MIKILRLLCILFLVWANASLASAPVIGSYYRFQNHYDSDVSSFCSFVMANAGYSEKGAVSSAYVGSNCIFSGADGASLFFYDPSGLRLSTGRCLPGGTAPDLTKATDQQCADPCPSGQSMGANGQCVFVQCPQGADWIRDVNLNCQPPACPSGTYQSGTNSNGSKICTPKVCPSPSKLLPDGTCGYAGDKGDKGDKGEKGDIGPKGDTGPKGDIGPKGDKGDIGEKGEKGDKGDKGDAGANGSNGMNGATGSKGDTGATGAVGAAGRSGLDGAAGRNGVDGSAGRNGVDGAAGPKGDMGAIGATGAMGLTGATGARGVDGVAGLGGAAGVDGGVGKDGQDGKSFCEEHPELNVCKDSAVNGSCGEITCTGDAIQCATLRAAAAIECRDKKDREDLAASPLVASGTDLISGNDPKQSQIDSALKGDKVDLSGQSLDQSGFLGGGSCFGVKTFSVMGRNVSYDFASVCQDIQPLRYVILIMAFIVSYMLISKSVLQG